MAERAHEKGCELDHLEGGCWSEGIRDAIEKGIESYSEEIGLTFGSNLGDQIENELHAFLSRWSDHADKR